MSEEQLFRQLRKNPPPPPWIAFPKLDRYSIGWRMGDGETLLHDLYAYLTHCSQDERESYMARFPEPSGWEGWYSNRDGVEIDGAGLLEIPEETRLSTRLSEDRSRLAVVGRRSDGLFRVRLYSRTVDPGLSGSFWGELGFPSIVDSQEAAERLVEELFETKQ